MIIAKTTILSMLPTKKPTPGNNENEQKTQNRFGSPHQICPRTPPLHILEPNCIYKTDSDRSNTSTKHSLSLYS